MSRANMATTVASKVVCQSTVFYSLLRSRGLICIRNAPLVVNNSSRNYSECIENKPSEFYDVVIAGGGMVGTTLACTLGENKKLSNKKILLLEASPEKPWSLPEKYSNRVVALNPHTKRLLTAIGAWDRIENARFKSVKKMQVWEASSDSLITFNHDDLSQDVAFIVENDVLLAAVTEQVQQYANVTIVNSAAVKDYKLPGNEASCGKVDVTMEGETNYSCSLLIGADGANSKVRKAMGCHYLTWNYDQMGIVATLKLSQPTENVVAWQRFLTSGPIALLPLTNELSSLVWSTTTDKAKELLQVSEETFVDAVNDALWKQHPRHELVESANRALTQALDAASMTTGTVRQLPPSVAGIAEGSRAAFPLAFGHASRYVGPGVALVGDSAHRVHPLAGQGVNLGFGDVECISQVLGEVVADGQALGSLTSLVKYERQRQRHNIPTMMAIDGLHRLYGTEITPLVILRSLGLQLTHALGPVKKAIMNQAAA